MKDNLRYYGHIAVLILYCFISVPAHSQTLEYTNSWVGNTFGHPDKHIPHDMENIYVSPSGKVATITAWEEGGHNVAVYDKDGNQICIPEESGTGSWGRNSGKAVFIDDNYVYQSFTQGGCDGNNGNTHLYPPCGTNWRCVRRYSLDGKGAGFSGGLGYDDSYLLVNTGGNNVSGIVIYNNELYASDPNSNNIKVYQAYPQISSNIKRTLNIGRYGLLDYDSQGYLWMLQTGDNPKIIRFSTNGNVQSQEISFSSDIKPTAFTVDKQNNRILVTNNGPDQYILIYDNIFSSPQLSGTFGQKGGIYAGTPGLIEPLKFSQPKGVGIDSEGNIYIANNGIQKGGGRLEKYTSGSNLTWRLNGLFFTDNGSIDPSSEIDFYSKEFHFTLDYSNTTPGGEWKLKGMTIDKFKYPDDFRNSDVNQTFWATAYVRNVQGKRLLYIGDMYGSGLAIYRFDPDTDGEIAIPAAYVSGGKDGKHEGKESVWTDNNGDQTPQENEYDMINVVNAYVTLVYPDKNGGIWKANREHGIRYFPLQGFDQHGNPIYTYASSTLFSLPQGTNGIKRVEYVPEEDALYVSGFSAQRPDQGDTWWCMGSTIAKYSNWLDGNRNPDWIIYIPFASSGSASDDNGKAFSIEGDYMFVIRAKEGIIDIYKNTDGSKVGEIKPTAVTGFKSGWADINGAVRAHKRDNGEYIIFAEENGDGKVMMYRWCPSGNCEQAPPNQPPTVQLTAPGNNTIAQPCSAAELSADASDPDGSISKVEFYDNGAMVGTSNTAPFTITIDELAPGEHQFTAKAYDEEGKNASSSQVIVKVEAVAYADFTSGITVDGQLNEAAWDVKYKLCKDAIGTQNNEIRFAALWNNEYLYVSAKVTDDQLQDNRPDVWENDAVEIYVDGQKDRNTSYDNNDVQVIKGYNDNDLLINASGGTGYQHDWSAIQGGYSIEVAIPWSDLGIIPIGGVELGFDLSNDDNDDGSGRQHQTVWSGNMQNFNNTSKFGTLVLQGATSVNLLTESSISIYPNPSSGTFIIDFGKPLTNSSIEIINLPGKVLMKKAVNQRQVKLEMNRIGAGIYFLKINSENGSLIRKVVVE